MNEAETGGSDYQLLDDEENQNTNVAVGTGMVLEGL